MTTRMSPSKRCTRKACQPSVTSPKISETLPWATSSGSEHEEADGQAEREQQRERDGLAAEGDALPGGRQRAGAHQPLGADDERLVEHDDAPEERGAGEAVAVQDAVERLLASEDLAVRPAHGHADGALAAHVDALHEGLAAVGEARHVSQLLGQLEGTGRRRPAGPPTGSTVRASPSARGASGSARPGRRCRRWSACPCRTGGSWSRCRRAAPAAWSRP